MEKVSAKIFTRADKENGSNSCVTSLSLVALRSYEYERLMILPRFSFFCNCNQKINFICVVMLVVAVQSMYTEKMSTTREILSLHSVAF